MTRKIVWRAFTVLIVIGLAAGLLLTRPIRLGLDLRGGTQIVLEAQDTAQTQVDDDTVSRTIEVMRRRVDQLGVAEPTIQQSGSRRIIIELPGVTDPDEALEVVGRTAQLTFHRVLDVEGAELPEPEILDPEGDPEGQEGEPGQDPEGEEPVEEGGAASAGQPEGDQDEGDQDEGDETPSGDPIPQDEEIVLTDESGAQVRLAPAALTGDAVGRAEAVVQTEFGANWMVQIGFRGEGQQAWTELTAEAACEPFGAPQRRVAIVLDDEIISSPEMGDDVQCNVGITGGDTVITGNFTADDARELALLIRAGALPVPVEVMERRTVGPTLGEAAIEASIEAGIIGGLLTILFIIVYYRLLGVFAAAALLIYGLLSYSVLLALGATLTLPGIAGFVLAIGMAVDANVLVFERTKEEFATGRSLLAASQSGFQRAWSAIADSNTTTLLAAILLFFFASGAVRGFGVTLTVGVLVSLFTAIVVTRLFVEWSLRSAKLRKKPGLYGMGVGLKLRERFTESPANLMGRSRLWLGVSALLVLAGVAGLVSQGLRYGIEFTGGRFVEYQVGQEVDLDEVRTALAGAGFPRAVVQLSGEENLAVRTGELTQADEEVIDTAVASVIGDVPKLRDEVVGPTIGSELRRRALIALGIALLAQLTYLAIRFRWTYGLGAVSALFHDVIILLGIFAWMGKEIDGVFIAAMLTVIGYSINDSVVVFDRVRETRRNRPAENLADITNDACLQTLPRTINTGLGALFILLALYFLGGETLTDFAFALIIGIVAGSYSSILTASPVFLEFEKVSPSVPPPASKETGVRGRVVREAQRKAHPKQLEKEQARQAKKDKTPAAPAADETAAETQPARTPTKKKKTTKPRSKSSKRRKRKKR